MDAGFTHIALPVRNLRNSLDFYARYATMRVVHRRLATDGATEVVWISDLTRLFVIVLVESSANDPPLGPFAHLGIAVQERAVLLALCRQATAEGCLVRGPEDSGPPVGLWAFLRDPDGHTVELSHGQDIEWAVREAMQNQNQNQNA